MQKQGLCMEIGPLAVGVLFNMLVMADGNTGEIKVTQAILANRSGCSLGAVKSALKLMVEKQVLIKRERPTRHATDVYLLNEAAKGTLFYGKEEEDGQLPDDSLTDTTRLSDSHNMAVSGTPDGYQNNDPIDTKWLSSSTPDDSLSGTPNGYLYKDNKVKDNLKDNKTLKPKFKDSPELTCEKAASNSFANDWFDEVPVEKAKPTRTVKAETDEQLEARRATRNAYSEAYLERYGIEPLFGRKEHSQIKQFVELVGQNDAPRIARFYLSMGTQWYLTKRHPVGQLLLDANAIRASCFTGSVGYATAARRDDQHETNKSVWEEVIDDIRKQYESEEKILTLEAV
jgi:hypothetical protein